MEERVIRCLEHVTVHREFVVTSVKMDVQQVWYLQSLLRRSVLC